MIISKNPGNGAVLLRPTEPADIDMVLAAESHRDNSLFIRQWSLQQHLEALRNPNIGHFIVTSMFDCQPVGHIILVGLKDPDLSLELRRIVITKKGAGFGRQALRAVMTYAFDEMVFHRLWLDVMLHNKRAFKLYQSEGFTVEGVHREAARQGGRFVDVRVMSILRHEYFNHYCYRPTRLLTDTTCVDQSGRVMIG